MDRLIEAIEDKQNPSVVGLDPTEALVPKQVVASFAEEIAEQVEDPTEAPAAQLSVAFFEFNRAIIDAVADIVPAVKPQIAMYEALGPAGIDAYSMTCEYAKQQGLYVLGDVKRGDIGSTAAAYAHHLNGVGDFDPWHEDAVTVNPYLGTDGITPFVDAATAFAAMVGKPSTGAPAVNYVEAGDWWENQSLPSLQDSALPADLVDDFKQMTDDAEEAKA